jgi:hypothetical protein
MLYYRLVTFLRWLVQSPEWQTGKKDKRRPNAVVPMGLVNVYLHIFLITLQKYKIICNFASRNP